jgi:hypothetical protein
LPASRPAGDSRPTWVRATIPRRPAQPWQSRGFRMGHAELSRFRRLCLRCAYGQRQSASPDRRAHASLACLTYDAWRFASHPEAHEAVVAAVHSSAARSESRASRQISPCAETPERCSLPTQLQSSDLQRLTNIQYPLLQHFVLSAQVCGGEA